MKKSNLYALFVFIGVFLVFIIGYYVYTSINSNGDNKQVYSCIDYETNTEYTFDNEEEMHSVCDKFNTNEVKEENNNSNSNEQNTGKDTVEEVEEAFDFYTYEKNNGKKAVIVLILDCNDIDATKKKALRKFSADGHNLNEYVVEYQYPCG